MTVSAARARCAALRVLPWDDVALADEIRNVTAALLEASPQVTPVAGAPGMWWIGASGLDASGGEPALAHALRRIAMQWHPAPRVAIADSCVAARAGTWDLGRSRSHQRVQDSPSPITHAQSFIPDSAHPTESRVTGRESPVFAAEPRVPGPESRQHAVIVPPGGCAAYLATVPLGLVPMDEALREALSALGICTAGAFTVFTAEDVERRWGARGLAAWRLARGEDHRRPGLTRADAPRCAAAELVPAVTTMEPVLFLVRAALDRLVRALVADGRAAATVAITLTLDDARGALPNARAHTITREVRLARPLARTVPLLERCRALLDRWSLTAPVGGVTVAIVATAPLTGEQGDLLDPAWRDPAAADAAFARLRATLGPAAIVVPITRDEHRPERAGAWVEVGESGIDGHVTPSNAKNRARSCDVPGLDPSSRTPALRQLAPPEPAEVECGTDGTPRAVRWRGRRVRLAYAHGPERLGGDWWQDGYARDYWRCGELDGETGSAGDLVLFRDHASGGGWYVHGWYD